MRRSIESYKKSIDADVEKDGAKEINWDNTQDTYNSLFTDEELSDGQIQINDDDILFADITGISSNGIAVALRESEELFSAEMLWEETKNVPIQDKLDAEQQDKSLKEQHDKFQEWAEKWDLPNAEMQKKLDEMAAELEGKF